MSTGPTDYERIQDASTETREKLAAAVQAEQDAAIEVTNKDSSAKFRREEHARLKAKADELREKVEAEAFGACFHRLLLAAMKRGSTNVVDILDSAMWAAGVGSVNRDTGAVSGPCTVNCSDPRGIHAVAGVMGGTANPHDLTGINTVVRGVYAGDPMVEAMKGRKPCPESEPAPPAYSVAERRVRADVAAKLSAILCPSGRTGFGEPGLEDALREVERRLGESSARSKEAAANIATLTAECRAQLRDAALEEAARVCESRAKSNADLSRRMSGALREAYDCFRKEGEAAAEDIRALKSKPAPQPSGNPGEFE